MLPKRPAFVVLWSFVWLSWCRAADSTATSAPPGDTRRPPNIVLILADDLGVQDLSCYGRRDFQTPHLDQLASQGLRFSTAYCAQPICSPSRAALMTGKCPARLHLTQYLPGRADAPSQRLLQPVIEGQLPVEEVTIAERLKSRGYATGLFGKWHLGDGAFGPRQQGFDEAFQPAGNSTPSAAEGGKHEFAITAAAEDFVRRHHDQPFFCYVAHHTPHIPLAAQTSRVESHRDAFQPVYAAIVETLDATVGRLLHTIDELKLSESTIVIFTSDNGGLHVLESPGTPATANAPFRAGKGFVYEGGLREPLLVRWPGHVAAGTVCDTPVVLTDLVPTLLEAAGVELANQVGPLDGTSLLPLWHGGALEARPLYWHFPHYTNQGGRPAGALRDGPWKLIEQYEDGALELYRLDTDPGESHDLAQVESARAATMQQYLAHWREQVGAQMGRPNPQFDASLHRQLYVDQDPARLIAAGTAAETATAWLEWRRLMNQVVERQAPQLTPATGDIRLAAQHARVHGQNLRYEPEPHKNVLGYWTVVTDGADWQVAVPADGWYEVEVQQGCGAGSGGAEVDVTISNQTLSFTVIETGHFQNMIQRTIGQVLLKSGTQTLSVQPRTKPGVAVMDLRRIVLRPVARE